MAKILNSPNQNVAGEHLILLQDAITKIKQLILKGASNEEINQVINNYVNKFVDPATKRAFQKSLIQSANKMMYQYNYNTNILNQSFIQKVVKHYNLGTGMTQANQTYTIDLKAIYGEYLNKQIDQRKTIEEFRNRITDTKYGSVLIKNYDKQVKDQVKLLASEPAKYVAKDGRAISLRNKVEMAVRYEANQLDLAQYKQNGIKLVWTSSHADASPRCTPFQGKLWSLDRTSGIIDGHRYQPIEIALDANGGNSIINGYNCRHYLIEYEKGSTAPRQFTSKEIQKEYKIDQKQRQYENRIRQLKTEETLLRQQGFAKDATRIRKSWQNLNKKYEEYSIKNGRAFYRWRTQISEEEKQKIIEVRNFNVLQKQINENNSNYTKPLESFEITLENGNKIITTQFELDKLKFGNDIPYSSIYMNEYAKIMNEFYSKYQKGVANENNFFLNTQGFFEIVNKRPDREPDYISINKRTGFISSEYWYTNEGVIRGSDHWGSGIASCDWFLNGRNYKGLEVKDKIEYGFIKWNDFVQKTKLIKVFDDEKQEIYLSNFENTIGRYKYNDLYLINNKVIDDTMVAIPYEDFLIQRENEKKEEERKKLLYNYHQNYEEIYLSKLNELIGTDLLAFLKKYDITYNIRISKKGNKVIEIPELKLQDLEENFINNKNLKKPIGFFLLERGKLK